VIRTSKFRFLMMVAVSAYAQAADLAVLRNGNSIRHERRQIAGAVTRLYLGDAAAGYIEIPTDQILRFETDTASPVAAAKTVSVSAPSPAKAQIAAISTSNPISSKPAPIPPKISVADRNPLSSPALDGLVSGAGERHQIDPAFINSVIRAESAFNNRAVSRKGAQGLMQLMPQTANQLGVKNPFDPNANVEGGTKYLRELLEKYNFDVAKALAAYNAGPHRVDQYRGVPPYYETQTYIARIIRDFNRQKIAENPALANKPAAKTNGAKSRPMPQAASR
jgi:soluble lytic murein transglycosylase-like protein